MPSKKATKKESPTETARITKHSLSESETALQESLVRSEDVKSLQKNSATVKRSNETAAKANLEAVKNAQKGSADGSPKILETAEKASRGKQNMESSIKSGKEQGRPEGVNNFQEDTIARSEGITKLRETSKKGPSEGVKNLKESSRKPPESIAKLQKNNPSAPQHLASMSSMDTMTKLAKGHSEKPPKTIAELARDNLPLNLPWIPQARPLPPGTLFHSRLCDSIDPWSKRSPFNPESISSISVLYKNDDGGAASFQSLETTSSNTSEEHLSVAFGITVGCSFLNASVTGGYDKDTLANNDARKMSIKASFRAGSIAMEQKPRLSLDAMVILKHQGGLSAFKEFYGDYYVAGYRLGGDAAVLLSETSWATSKVETLSVKVSVQVLFAKASKTHEKFFRSSGAGSGFRVSGFDTLGQRTIPATDPVSVYCLTPTGGVALEEVANTAKDMEMRCVKLAERVTRKIEDLQLTPGEEISWERLETLLENPLVVEMILLPVTSLREVQEWSLSKDVIGF